MLKQICDRSGTEQRLESACVRSLRREPHRSNQGGKGCEVGMDWLHKRAHDQGGGMGGMAAPFLQQIRRSLAFLGDPPTRRGSGAASSHIKVSVSDEQ